MERVLMIFLFLLGIASHAQILIQGTVTDKNNQPIPGTNVALVGKAEGTITDFDGNFSFSTSQEPPFRLRFSSIGFSNFVAEIASSNQTLSVILEDAPTLLDEIVVSASRTPERIFESPVSVERYGLQEIKNTSSESFYSGLQNLKGVDINTNSLTFQSINTRGFADFANTRFLQLVDGMDNSAPGLNFVLGNLVGLSELDVQSIEILPGASSALYGAGAFNGILFMNSKNPFDFPGVSAYAKGGLTVQEAAGTNPYNDFGVRVAHVFSDKLAVKATLSYLKGEDWHAVNIEDLKRPGADRTNPAYDGLNVYGDEVDPDIDFDAFAGLPSGTIGTETVSRTGYDERDLTDYEAESVKGDFALHYRPFADDFEIIYNGRAGYGSTIFQGANRYYIDNFLLQQHKLEFRNDHFFLRGYITAEDAGDSYDMRFAGINVNRQWKSDQQWFGEYINTYISTFLAGFQGQGLSREEASALAHAAARPVADTGRLIPGTSEFQSAFNTVISDGDLATGAKFIDNTKLRHVNGNYNIAHLINNWANVQLGGSWREYELNSSGTIFTDLDGPIVYDEYGAYGQLQKKFLDERLKFTGSVRYDKNEFFDGFLSPRLALGYTLGENRKHNVRASVQQGFRNPTTQDLFIGLNTGERILVGSSPTNLDRDIRTFSVNRDDLAGGTTIQIAGRNAYENSFTQESVDTFEETGNLSDLRVANPDLVQPEEITAFEVGYRGQIGKFIIDVSGYYNRYENLIVNEFVAVPFYGNVAEDVAQIQQGQNNPPDSAIALENDDFAAYQTYTNSPIEVGSFGANIGVDTRIFGNFNLGVNYTYAELDLDQDKVPEVRTNFNTPKHRVKASFGNPELLKNFGFGVDYRWSDSFFWESSFADGDIPAYTVVDAQVNYTVSSIKSVFKAGGSNLLNDEYFTAIGTGLIGSIYYVSWTINP